MNSSVTSKAVGIVGALSIVACAVVSGAADPGLLTISSGLVKAQVLAEDRAWLIVSVENETNGSLTVPNFTLRCNEEPCDGWRGSVDLSGGLPLDAGTQKLYVLSSAMADIGFTELSVDLQGSFADGREWSNTIKVGTVEVMTPVDEVDKALLAEYQGSDASSFGAFLDRKVSRAIVSLGCDLKNPCFNRLLSDCDWCSSDYYVARSYRYLGSLIGQLNLRGCDPSAAPSKRSTAFESSAVRAVLDAELNHLRDIGKMRETRMLHALSCITDDECQAAKSVGSFFAELETNLMSEE